MLAAMTMRRTTAHARTHAQVCHWRGQSRVNTSNICSLPKRLKKDWVDVRLDMENIEWCVSPLATSLLSFAFPFCLLPIAFFASCLLSLAPA
jgi:hypothetical protein